MTIHINHIAIDFSLEKEETVADVIAALRHWMTQQGLAVLGVLADGRAVAGDDQTPLHEVQQIDVEAVPAGEGDLARLAVVHRYFDFLVRAIESGQKSTIQDLETEFSGVNQALRPLLEPLSPSLAHALESLDTKWTQPQELLEPVHLIITVLKKRHEELKSPSTALQSSIETLEIALDALADLSQHFQRGEDREGFGKVIALLNAYEDLVRRSELVERIEKRVTPSADLFHALAPLWKEVENSLTLHDYVLIGDLVEYELIPRLRDLLSEFHQVSNLDRVLDLP